MPDGNSRVGFATLHLEGVAVNFHNRADIPDLRVSMKAWNRAEESLTADRHDSNDIVLLHGCDEEVA